MTQLPSRLAEDAELTGRLLPWVASKRGDGPEETAFLSGAALACFNLLLDEGHVPQALLRERLALRAAEGYLTRVGRPERTAELRDEVHLLRPGDQPGPAGAIYMQWRRAVSQRVSMRMLSQVLPAYPTERIAEWLDAGKGGPVACAAQALETVKAASPRDETAALMMAESALTRALGWTHLVPLLATALNSRELRLSGAELQLACHKAIVRSVREAVPLAADLTRRVARLTEVAPKLRARGAGQAVEIVRTRDAVAPAALTHLMSDRAARRFCDRLVTLGAARELTGRDTFRLYGV